MLPQQVEVITVAQQDIAYVGIRTKNWVMSNKNLLHLQEDFYCNKNAVIFV